MSEAHNDLKILVVGDPGSIHTAKFSSLLSEIGYHVEIFQSEYYYAQEENLHDTKIHVAVSYLLEQNNNQIFGESAAADRILKTFESSPKLRTFLANRLKTAAEVRNKRPKALASLILKYRPDVIFSLKMQNDGYTMAEAKKILDKRLRIPWVHFTWGTDIEFFGKHPDFIKEHRPKIKQVLQNCDFFMADSLRDVNQAKLFGLKGINLGQCLATGGYNLDEFVRTRKNTRKKDIILIKGRQGGHIGKALNILWALSEIEDYLKNYEIKIMMATPDVEAVTRFLSRKGKISYETLGRLPYPALLKLFAESKIAISATDVDGTPSFLVESMLLGAFPIHSDMASIREWVDDGRNGLLFGVDDIEELKSAILKAINDPTLLKQAEKINWQIAKERMDRTKIRKHVKTLIEEKILLHVKAN